MRGSTGPSPHRTRPLPRWAALPAGDSSAGVYGTLLALSVLVGLSIDGAGPGVMVVVVAVTTVVFWLAHVHSGVVARWVRAEARPGRATIVAEMRRESPMIGAVLPVLALLLLAWAGVVGQGAAVWTSLGYGLVALLAWGILIARAAGLGTGGVVAVAAIEVCLGVGIVVLKLLVH